MTPCPVCDSTDRELVLERRGTPVHQNLPRSDAAAARAVARGDLRLGACRACGFVANDAFDPRLLEYGEGYDNDQNWSAHFEAHVEGLVQRLVGDGVHQRKIVEVGCGSGAFLRRLCERSDSTGIGFDPSYQGPDSVDGGRVTFRREYYGAEHQSVSADVVICRHVIEHVPRPLELLRNVKAALRGPARLFFETPDVEWILRRLVVQDFFYEHCSYFTGDSLELAFQRTGFLPERAERVFGEQYLWLAATHDPARTAPPIDLTGAAGVAAAAVRYGQEEERRSERILTRLRSLRGEGRIAVWGAGAKGVTYLNLLDPDGILVDCVVDINPRKQGLYLPGTGHPIVGPDALRARHVTDVVVMNANYLDEIRGTLVAADLTIRTHDEAEL